MRERREAMHGTPIAARARRRGIGRLALLASTAMLVLLGSATAASASNPKLTKVTPAEGCPGTEVTLTGTGFTGSTAEVEWTDNSAQKFPILITNAVVKNSTTATAIEPFMLQTQGSGGGGVGLVNMIFNHSNTNSLSFT